MIAGDITLYIAVVAGIVSFLSPCVLPIIPGFLAYLASTDTNGGEPTRMQVLTHSALFVFGFALVFALIGVLLNTILAYAAYDAQVWLARVGGVVIIVFGLFLMGLIRIPILERAHTLKVRGVVTSKHLTSVLFGAAFAAGWTPCVSAALGAILGLAATNPGIAFWLLMAYALGLGLPFLLIGVFASDAQRIIVRFTGALGYINVAFGALLIVLGVLIFTQELSQLANFGFLNSLLLR